MARWTTFLVLSSYAYRSTSSSNDRNPHDGDRLGPVMVTHPLWREAVDRVPLADALEDRHEAILGLSGGSPVASRHVPNAHFPAQVFRSVCLRFESEVEHHVLRGGAPFWHRERGKTTLVVIKSTAGADGSGAPWPKPRQLPLVFSEQTKARGDIASDNGSWVEVDWDLIPHGAPMNQHAHPARKWARKPGIHPRVSPRAGWSTDGTCFMQHLSLTSPYIFNIAASPFLLPARALVAAVCRVRLVR